jgi:cytochrome c2
MPSPRAKGLLLALVLVASGAAATAAVINQRAKQTRLAVAMTGGDPDRAIASAFRFGCTACHEIQGAQAPGGLAAPTLSGFAQRIYIGGIVENSPDNLVRWIVDPKQFSRDTAMPVTGIGDAEARDIAAYLYRER